MGNDSNKKKICEESNEKENVSNKDDKPDWLLAIEENKKRRAERKKEREMMRMKDAVDDGLSNISNMDDHDSLNCSQMSNTSRASLSSGSQISNNSAASQMKIQENARNNFENASTISSDSAISSSQPSLYASNASQERANNNMDEILKEPTFFSQPLFSSPNEMKKLTIDEQSPEKTPLPQRKPLKPKHNKSMPDFSFVDSVIKRLAAEDAARMGTTDKNQDDEALKNEAKSDKIGANENTNTAPTNETMAGHKKATAPKGKTIKSGLKENAAKVVPATDKPKKKRGPNKKKAESINSSTIIGPTPELQVQSNSLNDDSKKIETIVDSSAIFAATPVTHNDRKIKKDAINNPVSDGGNSSVPSNNADAKNINAVVETANMVKENTANIEMAVENTNNSNEPPVTEENGNTDQNDTGMNVDNSETNEVAVDGDINNLVDNAPTQPKEVDPYSFPLSSEQESEVVTLNNKTTINNVKNNFVGKSAAPKKSFECFKVTKKTNNKQITEKWTSTKKPAAKEKEKTNENIVEEGDDTPIYKTAKDELIELALLRTGMTQWIQCDACDKWRKTTQQDVGLLPDLWYCRLNKDNQFNRCDIPEETSDEKLNDYWVQNRYTTGSLVWIDLTGWPRWPAMVDDDPDSGTFFWSTYEQGDSEVYEKPDLYHVTFFDAPNQPVTRAWMNEKNMTTLTSENLQMDKVKGRLRKACEMVGKALDKDLKTRRLKFSFAARFTGPWGPSWKLLGRRMEDLDLSACKNGMLDTSQVSSTGAIRTEPFRERKERRDKGIKKGKRTKASTTSSKSSSAKKIALSERNTNKDDRHAKRQARLENKGQKRNRAMMDTDDSGSDTSMDSDQIKKAPAKKQTRRTASKKSNASAKPAVVAKKSAIAAQQANKEDAPVKEKEIPIEPPNYEMNNLFNRQSIFTMEMTEKVGAETATIVDTNVETSVNNEAVIEFQEKSSNANNVVNELAADNAVDENIIDLDAHKKDISFSHDILSEINDDNMTKTLQGILNGLESANSATSEQVVPSSVRTTQQDSAISAVPPSGNSVPDSYKLTINNCETQASELGSVVTSTPTPSISLVNVMQQQKGSATKSGKKLDETISETPMKSVLDDIGLVLTPIKRRLTMLEGGKDQQVPAGEEEHMDKDMDYSMDEALDKVKDIVEMNESNNFSMDMDASKDFDED